MLFIVAAFFLVPAGVSTSLSVLEESQQSISDTNGPEFDVPFGNLSIDFHPESGPVNISLMLRVEVTAPSGVDTVIGSYRLDDENEWHNKTLSYTPREGYPDLYSAFVMNRTLCSGDWGGKWYFKFYANDTLGNWNNSSVWFESFFGGGMPSPASSIFLNPLFWIAVVATVLVIAILVRRFLKNR